MAYKVFLVAEDSSQRTIAGVLKLIENIATHFSYPVEAKLIPKYEYFVAASWSNDIKRFKCAGIISACLALDNGIVLVNYDADQKYTKHPSTDNSKSLRKDSFFHLLKSSVKEDLIASFDFSEEAADQLLSKVIPMVPYWNIESWAYMNKTKLKDKIRIHSINCPEAKSILSEKNKNFDEKKISEKGKNLTDNFLIGKDVFNDILFQDSFPLVCGLQVKKSLFDFANQFETALKNHRPW